MTIPRLYVHRQLLPNVLLLDSSPTNYFRCLVCRTQWFPLHCGSEGILVFVRLVVLSVVRHLLFVGLVDLPVCP
jgi:hypothetical protein